MQFNISQILLTLIVDILDVLFVVVFQHFIEFRIKFSSYIYLIFIPRVQHTKKFSQLNSNNIFIFQEINCKFFIFAH